ncbi:MAG: RNA methyltransferase [Caldilineaceae bacterium]
MLITSLQNTRIKDVIKLEKHNERERRRLTVVEGIRECSRALTKGIVPVEVYLCDELMQKEMGRLEDWETPSKSPISPSPHLQQSLTSLQRSGKTQLFTVTPEVFAKLAYRGDSGGILMVIPYLDTQLSSLPLNADPFLVVIEGVEKPGNLGAILRTADAAGVDGVIVSAGATDLHNPNVVRASLGTLFSVPLAEATAHETIAFLKQHQIQLVAADPEGSKRYTAIDLRGPSAIVMGSEAFGLSDAMRNAADQRVSIPMHGLADSLNLATATALMLYEVVRQRNAS